MVKAYALYNFNTVGGNPMDNQNGNIVAHFWVFVRDLDTQQRNIIEVDSVLLPTDTDSQAHVKNTTAVKNACDAIGMVVARTNIRFAGWTNGQ